MRSSISLLVYNFNSLWSLERVLSAIVADSRFRKESGVNFEWFRERGLRNFVTVTVTVEMTEVTDKSSSDHRSIEPRNEQNERQSQVRERTAVPISRHLHVLARTTAAGSRSKFPKLGPSPEWPGGGAEHSHGGVYTGIGNLERRGGRTEDDEAGERVERRGGVMKSRRRGPQIATILTTFIHLLRVSR